MHDRVPIMCDIMVSIRMLETRDCWAYLLVISGTTRIRPCIILLC